MSERAAGLLFDEFKRSPLTLQDYCKRRRWDKNGFRNAMREHFGDEWEHVIEAKVPRTTLYRRGRRFEYRVRDYLQAAGYFVLRSPASRSPIDLLAVGKGQSLFVQAKRSGYCGPQEWNELLGLAESVQGAVPLLVEPGGKRGEILFWMLTGRKDGSKRRQPRKPFEP